MCLVGAAASWTRGSKAEGVTVGLDTILPDVEVEPATL